MEEIPLILLLIFLLQITILYNTVWMWIISIVIVLEILVICLRRPQAPRHNVSEFFRGFTFGGHRGSPVNTPENTMASFLQAVNEGVNLIEFDIGLTKDNVPVLMHDDTMDRTTNMNGPLRRRMFADLVNCNCAAKFTKSGPMDTATTSTIDLKIAPEPLATLEEVVKWAKSRNIKMIFDMKDDDIALIKQVARLFEEYDLFNSAIVCSFSISVIYRIKGQNRFIMTGITWRRFYYQEKEFKLNTGWLSFIFPHCAVALDLLWTWFIKLSMPQILGVDMILTERGVVSENYVNLMQDNGFHVCAWTVNDEREMAWMAHTLKIPFLTDLPHIANRVINEHSAGIDYQSSNLTNTNGADVIKRSGNDIHLPPPIISI